MIKSYICDHCGDEISPCDIRVVYIGDGCDWHLCKTCCNEYNEIDNELKRKERALKMDNEAKRLDFLLAYGRLKYKEG